MSYADGLPYGWYAKTKNPTNKLSRAARTFIDNLGNSDVPDTVDTLPYARCYSVPLNCEHRAIYISPRPARGEILYCRKCDNYRVVTGRAREVHNS